MSLPGRVVGRLRRDLNRLSDPPALILMYHRVARPAVDPWGIAVSPEHFAEQLEVLRRRARPVALADIQAGRGARVALTFDDGYADNLHAALPVLERYGVPATVFVVSGSTGQPRPFWWDELALLLLGNHPLPGQVQLSVRGKMYGWSLDGQPLDPSSWQRWRAEAGPPEGPRERAYLELYWLLRTQPAAERDAALEQLRGWAGRSSVHPDDGLGPHHRPLSTEELSRLAAHPLVQIGAHTVTHPPLADLTPDAQRAEITGSSDQLASVLGRAVTAFSLPHGSADGHTGALLREAGFRQVCTSVPAAVRRATSPLALPRLNVEDWNGDEFAALLKHFL